VYKHSVRRPLSETEASPRRNSNVVNKHSGRRPLSETEGSFKRDSGSSFKWALGLKLAVGLQWFAGAALRCFLPCRAMAGSGDWWSADAEHRGQKQSWSSSRWQPGTFNIKKPKFEGAGADLVHNALVVAVRKVQGSNLASDDIWKTWVETFANEPKPALDPAKHGSEFLLAFLSHLESVELTLTMHQELGEQTKDMVVKQRRLQERRLPDDLYERIQNRSRGVPSSSDRRPLLAAETQTEAVTPPPVLAAETQTEAVAPPTPPTPPRRPPHLLALRIPCSVEDFFWHPQANLGERPRLRLAEPLVHQSSQ